MAAYEVSSSASQERQPSIGLIGMGEMGRMYCKRFSNAGWAHINVCDRPENFENLKADVQGLSGVSVLKDGHLVSRVSDIIFYSVEAEYIDKVVAEYGQSTKVGAIVAGQTSVKSPEKLAFEKYLPNDVHIVSCHSLHGPTVSTEGQPLVLIQHRAPDWALHAMENLLASFKSRYVYLTYDEHDVVTANTQAVTHAAFLSMGTAWHCSMSYPWEMGQYVGGIETVKVNIMLRIYANKWHVYAGLAILNPSARMQIDQYAQSVTDLFKMMISGDEVALKKRMYEAREIVFSSSEKQRPPILLSEEILDRFSLGVRPQTPTRPSANSHLSLLAMVDCWAALRILPYKHLDLAATPIFRMWIGVAEYLFRSNDRLDAAVQAAVHDVSHRSDDLEFVVAARGWSQCVSFGSFELYRERFTHTATFFESRFPEANRVGSQMIKAILEAAT
ncbi:prephenate dehydrogenase [Dacryopinax primogenitus]|uniref:Prephenate dehydrogenase [NADP(+)] n=1 Tax=Dacryopinax primogenitus (strain DJM 731) TaxID=1858805 RepID=M5GBJ6_DACPD|nr:prephenate dehydrogenase [Dacryopinax primogenitus]EJU03432.1 prephenate dehydrogenase [Dacryopinax primogenitus]